MSRVWILVAIFLVPGSILAQPADTASRTWGQRLADTVIAEFPEVWSMRKSDGEYRWAYTQGLVTLGMYRLSRVGAFLLASAEIE